MMKLNFSDFFLLFVLVACRMLVLNMYNIGCHPLLTFKVSILHQKCGLPTNAMLYVVVFVVVVVVVVFVVAGWW